MVEEDRHLELARLAALQASLWERAMGGDVSAAQTVLRLIETRCRLLALVVLRQSKVCRQQLSHRLHSASRVAQLGQIPLLRAPIGRSANLALVRKDAGRHAAGAHHAWREACRRVGVTGFTLHALRHFWASGLIANGCGVVTVQRALGHAKVATLITYAHLWPTAENGTRAAADRLMSAARADSRRPSGL